MRFRDIKSMHLQAVIDNSKMAHPTRSAIKTLFTSLYKFAIKNDIADKDYAKFVDVGKREGISKRKPFSNDEIKRLFECEDKLEFADTVLIMIYTGMRVGELLALKTEDIHLDERYMIGGLKTEAGINRIIPINKRIEPFIRKYYNEENEFLITNHKGEQMKYSNYRREKFDNVMEKLEIEHSPHDCRHTFASLMDSVNANKLCTKRIMGHKSQDITDDVYTHKTISELINAIDLL